MDGVIYPRPLAECGLDIAGDLQHAGRAGQCNRCEKSFTPARKWHSICRIWLWCDDQLHSWSWFLCRKCAREAKGRTPPSLLQQATSEARLLMAKPGGSA